MAAASAKTYVVQTHSKDTYEVSADRMEVDPDNSNRVTFYKGDDVVAQENNASSARPK